MVFLIMQGQNFSQKGGQLFEAASLLRHHKTNTRIEFSTEPVAVSTIQQSAKLPL
jgi:hypothetical protein